MFLEAVFNEVTYEYVYHLHETNNPSKSMFIWNTISLLHSQFPFGINIILISGDRKDKSSQKQNWQPDVTTPSQEDDQRGPVPGRSRRHP